jgi:DNA-binding protein H-NS
VAFANLSAEEIRRQLEEIEQNKTELERALTARRQEEKQGVVQQIRDLIISNGYELDEIVPMITTSRRRRAGGSASPRATASGRDYTRYVDPENPENVYVRGVLPGWMKKKMQEQGYDPSLKSDRESFKANYLQVLEG